MHTHTLLATEAKKDIHSLTHTATHTSAHSEEIYGKGSYKWKQKYDLGAKTYAKLTVEESKC